MLGLCSADDAGGGWRQNPLVAVVAAVVILVGLTTFTCRACRRSSEPELLPVAAGIKGVMRWCLDCKKEFLVTTSDIAKLELKDPKFKNAPGAIKAKRVPCPSCGGTRTAEAIQCENCGRYFCPAAAAKDTSICPHCKKRPYKR